MDSSQGFQPLEEGRAKTARLMRELVRETALEVPVTGQCMAPLLIEGERVGLEPVSLLWPGDVVAFRSADGRLLLHRFLGYWPTTRGLRLLTRADSAPAPDAPVEPASVIGRLAERAGRPFKVPIRTRLTAAGRFGATALRAIARRLHLR